MVAVLVVALLEADHKRWHESKGSLPIGNPDDSTIVECATDCNAVLFNA